MSHWQQLKNKALELTYRTADQHVRLAVTGLAGAGKTAFITAIINKLINASPEHASQLPLFTVCLEHRLLETKRVLQPDLQLASFAYDAALAQLTGEQAQWPASTTNISELRLAIKYRPKQGFRGRLLNGASATLLLDIVDYPGEWLLDLPMLEQDYQQWCRTIWATATNLNRSPFYDEFKASVMALQPAADASDELLAAIANHYQRLLQDMVQQQGFYLAQPGRMLLPGDLAGAPILSFFPLLPEQLTAADAFGRNSIYQILEHRYQEYVAKVVRPFYHDYFAGFDRQLVLVDCFTALNRGKAQFDDMTKALNAITQSFRFGRRSLLRRLFAPKIDCLLFAASKVDQITRDQQGNVLALLNAILAPGRNFADSAGCAVETMAVSAIRATKPGMVRDSEYGEQEVVVGNRLSDRQPVTLYPGQVPRQLPDAVFWQQQGFRFCDFAPPQLQPGQTFEHIRLDYLLNFLLGDKLQ
ncbi:YcjX family protein [Shewanella sp. 4t3-1-2LB]|uniref:YcjX family protein n=1 Tax=Shewanella sp. 4t3-1-2LB TaxID=2817682 RepID=UPI001A988FED|nr:YcjX family protein [Shewanella sp. 4t3-1-2LB]MBO1273209.1 YcjX family protein [Shewanella sp. 4t3-1-2LB]